MSFNLVTIHISWHVCIYILSCIFLKVVLIFHLSRADEAGTLLFVILQVQIQVLMYITLGRLLLSLTQ